MNVPAGPVIKICGLTRLEDVVAARDLGVWALGFVFAPSSRRLEPGAARGLLEAAGLGRRAARHGGGAEQEVAPLTVGVFTDAEAGEIARVADQVGLDAVQLHGLYGPSVSTVVAALGGAAREVLIIKAVPVDPEETDAAPLGRALAQARAEANIVLLDTKATPGPAASALLEGAPTPAGVSVAPSAQFGGSGAVFRWRLVREAAASGADGSAGKQAPLLVAGGIGPQNVLQALAESGAWGVDVSSGVESAPGIKDAGLMARLVARVNEGIEQ